MRTAAAFAILNFIWQGAAIGALAWLGFALSRSPRIRYLIGIGALAAMAAAPVVTAIYYASVVAESSPTVQSARPLGVLEPLALEANLDGVGDPAGVSNTRWTWSAMTNVDPRVATVVLVAWLLGVAALSTRLAFGWLGARRLTRQVDAASANVQAIANRLIVALNIRARIRIVESALVNVPAVVGAFKPVVLLPAAALSGLSMEQVEALLAHELAHVRRHDYLVNLIQAAVETLLFYHPAVWLVSRRVRQERELCCDDLALAVCSDRVAYASALADLESFRAVPSPALAATGGSLLSRIRRILGHDDVSALAGRSKSLAGIAILASIILLAGGQAARARAGVPATDSDSLRAESSTTPPQAAQVPQGIQVGVAGGVQGGVPGGVAGGVQDGVPILVSANDDPMLKISPDTDITVRVKSNGKVVKEFSDKPIRVAADGFAVLPMLGKYPIGGRTLREAASAIRSDLIFRKFFADPEVDVRANMMIVAAEPLAAEVPPAERLDNVPQQRIVGPFKIGDHIRIDIGYYGDPTSVRHFVTVPAAGTLDTSMIESQIPHFSVVNGLKVAGETSATIIAELSRRYRSRDLPVPALEVTFDDRHSDNASRYARREGFTQAATATSAALSLQVSVQGAVRRPGSLELRADRATISDAIAAAGGFQPRAGSRILLKRAGAADRTYSKVEMLQGRGDPVSIQNGDVISVEVASHFYVTDGAGNSTRELDWEPGITLGMALALASGVSADSRPVDRAVLQGWVAQSRREWQRAGIETQNKEAAWATLNKIELGDDPVVAAQAAPLFSADRFVITHLDDILAKERYLYQLREAEKLGEAHPRVTAVKTEINLGRVQLKARLMQIVDSARQQFENAKATEARYKELYVMQEAQSNSPVAGGAFNRTKIERKDPKTGKVTIIKLNKDPMTTPIEPDDVIKVPVKRM